MEEEFLTIREVCEMLKISDQTLSRMRKKGILRTVYPHGAPSEVGPGRALVRLLKSDVMKLVERA